MLDESYLTKLREYGWTRAADEIEAIQSKLKAADEAWHEQEDELQSLRSRLDAVRRVMARIENRGYIDENYMHDFDDPESDICQIREALKSTVEPPK